ncbi:UNVERIFIED_CONTAM: hypothetical protein GTU68_034824 [Idotea baltica]|nr:hypothetical protein [Idotea baltica]
MSLNLSDPSLLKAKAYVNGQWIEADNGDTFPVNNPATGELIVDVAKLGASETGRAIEAAQLAMDSWKLQPAKTRAGILRKWYDLMMEHQEDLAIIMTAEQGKVLAESRGEVAYGAAFIEWFGEEAKRIDGDVIPGPSSDRRIVCIKQPVGVVAAITPWNFPNAMIARKAAPALAAGCSIVIKPATETPLSAFAMAELAERAGVPAGVLNVIAGSSGAIGGEITGNPIVRKLTFTGSTPAVDDVDQLVQGSVAEGAKVALGGGPHELGGCFYQPTILTEVSSAMPVFRNEIFGPVAPVVRFNSESEVIAMANDTEFGLASYFYTRDIGRVWRVAEALDYGIVGINEGIISNEMAPFGGVKESGSGREGSKYGIDDYVEIKYMLMGGLDN